MNVHQVGQLNFTTILLYICPFLNGKKSFKKCRENSNGKIGDHLVNLIEDLTKMRIPSEINLPLTGSAFQTVYFEASWRSQGNNLETL